MLHDAYTVQFHGFHPSPETEQMVREKLELLHEKAPSGATTTAKFFRHDGHLKATVTINSFAGRFFAVASGEHLREVIHAAVEQIQKQLDRSKSIRVRRHQGLRDLFAKIPERGDFLQDEGVAS